MGQRLPSLGLYARGIVCAMALTGLLASPAFADGGTIYAVQPGDVLSGIAAQFSVSADTLAQINHLADPNLIQIGEQIAIPAGSPAPVPSSMTPILQAPYRSQFDGTIWGEGDCGPATLAMALGAFGTDYGTLDLRASADVQMGIRDPYDGTTWDGLAYAAEVRGFGVQGLYTGTAYHIWSIQGLMNQIDAHHPVILLVRFWDLPDHSTSSYGGDHYILAKGFDAQGNLVYNDSAFHPEQGSGADRTISQSSLMEAWTSTSVGLVRTAMAITNG